MKHNHCYFFPTIFIALALCSMLNSCNNYPECENSHFKYRENWESSHLDNSGSFPVISTKAIPRTSYGFRLRSQPSILNNSLTDCNNWQNYFPFSGIQILLLGEFDGLPAGSDITSRFMGRLPAEHSDTEPHAQYLTVSEMLNKINYPNQKMLQDFYVDFILIEAPANPQSLLLEVILTHGMSGEIKINFFETELK